MANWVMGLVIITNSSNGERLYTELLERFMANTFTPIEWERFTPHDKVLASER